VKLEWRRRAQADLAELVAFIAADDPAAAYRVHDAIILKVALLLRHPDIGRPGRVRGTRELVVTGTPYIVAYRAVADLVTVLRVLHGARRWPDRV
jgi:toxin ParE1/3/4